MNRTNRPTVAALLLEHARLTTELHAVARTYGSSWEALMAVSRRITPVEAALRALAVAA